MIARLPYKMPQYYGEEMGLMKSKNKELKFLVGLTIKFAEKACKAKQGISLNLLDCYSNKEQLNLIYWYKRLIEKLI